MSNTPILGLPVAIGLDGSEYMPLVQGTGSSAVTKRAQTSLVAQLASATALPAAIEYVIDGGGGNVPARTFGYLQIPFNATVTSWDLFADVSGSIIVNVWKCTYAQFDAGVTHPVAGDSITGTDTPTITSATKARSTALTGWTTTLAIGDVLAFNVPSTATNITRVTLNLQLSRVVS